MVASLLLWLNGRVAGVSGILNGVIFSRAEDGPALAGLGIASIEALWFVPAMIAGMLLHRIGARA